VLQLLNQTVAELDDPSKESCLKPHIAYFKNFVNKLVAKDASKMRDDKARVLDF
jgi:hypothetical protein